mgnify:CR=1 FL=1
MGNVTRSFLKTKNTNFDNILDSMVVLESAQGAVTQATNQTTAVTINATSGIITLVAAATNATVNNEFTVNNSFVKSNSVILVTVQDENTTNNTSIMATTHTIADGSFIINLQNPQSSGNTSTTASKIHFLVVNNS